MPRRSLQKSSIEDFEPKRKNAILLGSDSNIDKDLKPLRVAGENTGIEISEDKIRFTKTLENLELVGTLTHSGDFFVDTIGDMNFDAHGQDINFLYNDNPFVNFNIANGLTLYDVSDVSDYFRIVPNHGGAGDTTILTSSDNSPPGGNLRIQPDGSLLITVADDSGGDNVTIDSNHTNTTDASNEGLHIDLDHTGICADGETISNTGIDLDVNSNSPTMVGTVNNYGLDIDVVGGTSGTQTNYGIALDVDGADTNIGMLINTAGTHIKLEANADVNDYATFTLADTGDLTIETVGSGSLDSDLTLDADGDIVLDAAGGQISIKKGGLSYGQFDLATASTLKLEGGSGYGVQINTSGIGDIVLNSGDNITIDAADTLTFDSDGTYIMMQDGAEFSVANSAYAGMILGYRMIGEDGAHDTYTLTSSMVVPDAGMTVRFIAPPSGSVEVMVQFNSDGAAGRTIIVGLSDNATYNSLGDTYEQISSTIDETDNYAHQHYWAITGLTSGGTYNYWLGVKHSAGTGYIQWGGTGAGRYCDFIMKATALPTAVSDFAEYD